MRVWCNSTLLASNKSQASFHSMTTVELVVVVVVVVSTELGFCSVLGFQISQQKFLDSSKVCVNRGRVFKLHFN